MKVIAAIPLAGSPAAIQDPLRSFNATHARWASYPPPSNWRLAKAWQSNSQGLSVSATVRTSGNFLVDVHDGSTGVVHLLGKAAVRGTQIDISEVIGNPNEPADRTLLDPVTLEFMQAMADAIRRGEMQHRAQVDREAVPLGCLFAWAASQATDVTLTANSFGLIAYYATFGFVMRTPVPATTVYQKTLEKLRVYQKYLATAGPVDEAVETALSERYAGAVRGDWSERLKDELEDIKFAAVNQPMILSGKAREALLARFRILVHWVGPQLAG